MPMHTNPNKISDGRHKSSKCDGAKNSHFWQKQNTGRQTEDKSRDFCPAASCQITRDYTWLRIREMKGVLARVESRGLALRRSRRQVVVVTRSYWWCSCRSGTASCHVAVSWGQAWWWLGASCGWHIHLLFTVALFTIRNQRSTKCLTCRWPLLPDPSLNFCSALFVCFCS